LKEGGQGIRAFVALELDPPSVRRIGRVSDRLRMSSGAPSASWTPHAKMHVTLKFLGDVREEVAVRLGRSLRVLAEGRAPPAPSMIRLDAFPSIEEARVVVALLADADQDIARLASQAERIALEHGVPEEDRAYRPHVTLARLKRAYDARKWLRADLADGVAPCCTTHLTLFRSHREQSGEGTAYVPLARFAFDAA
jgi:2'-5' RNA ligase